MHCRALPCSCSGWYHYYTDLWHIIVNTFSGTILTHARDTWTGKPLIHHCSFHSALLEDGKLIHSSWHPKDLQQHLLYLCPSPNASSIKVAIRQKNIHIYIYKSYVYWCFGTMKIARQNLSECPCIVHEPCLHLKDVQHPLKFDAWAKTTIKLIISIVKPNRALLDPHLRWTPVHLLV